MSDNRPARRGAGRPSREEQGQRREELLDMALDVFMEKGFEQATMEDIAAALGMSKRTIYAIHEDKAALFRAAVRRAIERYTIPRERLEEIATGDLRSTLMAIGRMRIANIATPVSTRLQRILSAQSYRFPEVFGTAFDEGAGPTIAFLADLFTAANAAGETEVTAPRHAAAAFLSLVVGGPARLIVLGHGLSEAEAERHVRFAVDLFLDGARARR